MIKKIVLGLIIIVVLGSTLESICLADIVSHVPDYSNFPSGYPLGHGFGGGALFVRATFPTIIIMRIVFDYDNRDYCFDI